MIFDTLENRSRYYALNPRMERAFDFLMNIDPNIEPGIHEIEGRDIFVNVMELDLKKPADAKLEVHNEYLDIQFNLTCDETYGWSPRATLEQPQGEFNEATDLQFFDDQPQLYYTLKQGQFTIFFSEDAHAPMIGEGHAKRVIVKVRQ